MAQGFHGRYVLAARVPEGAALGVAGDGDIEAEDNSCDAVIM